MLQRILLFTSLLFSLGTKADRECIIYHDDNLHPHFIMTMQDDSIVKCTRINIKGDTIYTWDARIMVFVWKPSIDNNLNWYMNDAELDYRVEKWKKNHSDTDFIEKIDDLDYSARFAEEKRNEYFFGINKPYELIFEMEDFRIIENIKPDPGKPTTFRKYFMGKVVVEGQLNKNIPHGIWIFYPYSLYKGFDIRWFDSGFDFSLNQGGINDHGNYGGLSLLYFFLPILLLFALFFVALKFRWYKGFYLGLIPLSFAVFIFSLSDYYHNSFLLATIILFAFLSMLSIINMFFAKRSGIPVLTNILCLVLVCLLSYFIYFLKAMENY
jgi:hypothetical protein